LQEALRPPMPVSAGLCRSGCSGPCRMRASGSSPTGGPPIATRGRRSSAPSNTLHSRSTRTKSASPIDQFRSALAESGTRLTESHLVAHQFQQARRGPTRDGTGQIVSPTPNECPATSRIPLGTGSRSSFVSPDFHQGSVWILATSTCFCGVQFSCGRFGPRHSESSVWLVTPAIRQGERARRKRYGRRRTRGQCRQVAGCGPPSDRRRARHR